MSALKQSGTSKNPFEDVQKKLKWGLDNNMKAELNSEIKLSYPDYANFVIAMLNDLEFYNKAIREVKTQLNTKQEKAVA